MFPMERLRTNLLVKLGEVTDRTHALPLVLFGVTARCNSRCVSCDFWQADGASDLDARGDRALGRPSSATSGRGWWCSRAANRCFAPTSWRSPTCFARAESACIS